MFVCVCVYVRACVRACVHIWVRACVRMYNYVSVCPQYRYLELLSVSMPCLYQCVCVPSILMCALAIALSHHILDLL